MKKFALLAASAAMLAACSQNEEFTSALTEEAPLPIEFGNYVPKATTRAGVTTESLETDGIGVIAWYTADAAWDTYKSGIPAAVAKKDLLFDNEQVSTSSWTYSHTKYWPNQTDGTNYGKVTFCAYGPYVATGDATDNLVYYATTGDHKNHPVIKTKKPFDYVVATADGYKNLVKPDNVTDVKENGKVTFKLARTGSLLEKITARVYIDGVRSGDDAETSKGVAATIALTSVVIKQVTTSATADVHLCVLDGTILGEAANEVDFTITGKGDAVEKFNVETSGTYNSDNITETKQEVWNKGLVVLSPASAREVEVNYTVTYTNPALVVEQKSVKSGALAFATGTKYVLNLVIGLDAVTFDVEATDWGTATEVTVDVPENTY